MAHANEHRIDEADKVMRSLSRDEFRLSYKGRMVNALASGADEGRDKLR